MFKNKQKHVKLSVDTMRGPKMRGPKMRGPSMCGTEL